MTPELPSPSMAGLPRAYSTTSISINRSAGLLIASLSVAENGQTRSRLFTRRLGDSIYQEVPTPLDATLSLRSVVVAYSAPVAFVNCFEVREHGHYWKSVLRLNLTDLTATDVLSRETLALGKGGERRWVADLMSTSGAGDEIVCVLGLESAESQGRTHAFYQINLLNVVSRDLEFVTGLEHVFL